MHQHIAYFIVDLDGCISEPFSPPNWQLLSKLRELSDQSKFDNNIPKLSICTGRPAPYAEAVGQWLNVQLPIIFESGAGMLNLSNHHLKWNPVFNDQAKRVIDKVMLFIQELKTDYPNIHPEISKTMDAGYTSDDSALITELQPIFNQFITSNCPELVIHGTPISTSALWPQANKGAGLAWLCDELGTTASNIAYIGDTSGDIPAIEYAAIGFAPQNANIENKNIADIITQGNTTAGVLEAWQYLIAHNRALKA